MSCHAFACRSALPTSLTHAAWPPGLLVLPQTPITYVSKHQEADVFVAPECVIGTNHGEEPEEIVLYE